MQMLKQIHDAIKFILNYTDVHVCIRRDRKDRSVVECVCVCWGAGGRQTDRKRVKGNIIKTLVSKRSTRSLHVSIAV